MKYKYRMQRLNDAYEYFYNGKKIGYIVLLSGMWVKCQQHTHILTLTPTHKQTNTLTNKYTNKHTNASKHTHRHHKQQHPRTSATVCTPLPAPECNSRGTRAVPYCQSDGVSLSTPWEFPKKMNDVRHQLFLGMTNCLHHSLRVFGPPSQEQLAAPSLWLGMEGPKEGTFSFSLCVCWFVCLFDTVCLFIQE